MGLTAYLRCAFPYQLIVTLLLLVGFFTPAFAETVPKEMVGYNCRGYGKINADDTFDTWKDLGTYPFPNTIYGRNNAMDACESANGFTFGMYIGVHGSYRRFGNGGGQQIFMGGARYFEISDTAQVGCPSSHPYEVAGDMCTDLPPECQDMDTMTESCCQTTATDYCAANGGSVVSWELTGLGYQYCDYSCDFDESEEPIETPPPETEEECEQAASNMCADRGGAYNYFWDSEYSSCAYSCNDNPEEIEQPPETDPANEPKCTLENGVYTGQCVDDDNPDNGSCTQRKDENDEPIDGEFEGQCVVGDEVSDSSRLDLANRHLLGISGGIKGVNNRLDELPDKMATGFGLGDFEEMQLAADGAYMKAAVRNEEETSRVGNWLRGLFGLGNETGGELIPANTVDLSDESSGFNNLISAPASCPAPVTVEMLGQSFQIPYDEFCGAFITMKPFFLAGCLLMAGFIVFGSRPS